MGHGELLIPEIEVLARWPALSKCGLRAARQARRIAWIRGKRGSAWYRLSEIEIFITKELEQPCRVARRDPNLNLPVNGSPKNQDAPATTVSGLTQELAEHAARPRHNGY